MHPEETFIEKELFIAACNKVSQDCVWMKDAIDDFDGLEPCDRKEMFEHAISLGGPSAQDTTRNERNAARFQANLRHANLLAEIRAKNRQKNKEHQKKRLNGLLVFYLIVIAICIVLSIPAIKSIIHDLNIIFSLL